MRTVSGMMLAVLVGVAAGCGKADPTPQPEPKAPLADPPAPGPTPATPAKDDPAKKTDPGVTTPPVPPPTPTAAWELDPAKHAIPGTPVAGKLGGAAFAPEAQFEGDTLSFRLLNKDGNPERQVALKFAPDRAKTVAGGLKLTVRQEQAAGPDVPVVTTEFPPPKPGPVVPTVYEGGYALTLELGKRDKGKLPGRVYLSLPGDDKDFLAGTFTAEWSRPVSEPPGPDDAPFVQGKVSVVGAADPQVKVGYAGAPKPDEVAADSAQLPLVGPGRWTRSDHAKPRVTTLVGAEAAGKPGRYEHINLPPGRYLVYAAVEGGPAVWTWVAVGPDAKLTADFEIDVAKVGRLDVALPAGTTGKVHLAPADDPGTPVPPGVLLGVAFTLGLEADVKDAVAAFAKLGPGRYEVRAGELTGTVEVKAGETAKVELKKK